MAAESPIAKPCSSCCSLFVMLFSNQKSLSVNVDKIGEDFNFHLSLLCH